MGGMGGMGGMGDGRDGGRKVRGVTRYDNAQESVAIQNSSAVVVCSVTAILGLYQCEVD